MLWRLKKKWYCDPSDRAVVKFLLLVSYVLMFRRPSKKDHKLRPHNGTGPLCNAVIIQTVPECNNAFGNRRAPFLRDEMSEFENTTQSRRVKMRS